MVGSTRAIEEIREENQILTFGCSSSILVDTLLVLDELLFRSTDVSLLYLIENSSFILEEVAPEREKEMENIVNDQV